ncbi:MAG: NAD(P)/FAD-dependent oxidoreductase [Candidatus Thorarchaeota archaeon]
MLDMKNKFIFAPVKTGYSDGSGIITESHVKFYIDRSKDVGAITLEPLYMDSGLRELPTQIGIDSDDKIEGLSRLIQDIHNSGAKVIAHLNHPGRMANPKIPGNHFVSSSAIACPSVGKVPEAMDSDDMKKVVALFTDAAVRAVNAGFDFIEIQFGHGYLLAQFLSLAVNQREDEYGGSFENRSKFPIEVLDAVKQSISIPIIARISANEMIPNGLDLPDMIKFSKMLQNHGVAAIHVSAGTLCDTPPWFFQHMFLPKGKLWEMASKIKKQVDVPIIFVGRINTIEDVQKVDRDLGADYIAVGRPLVADHDFIAKVLGKDDSTIVPCLACAEGCLGGVKSGVGLLCLVNPAVGKESIVIKPASQLKNIAVVGGGLAGMEATIRLSERGHSVDLYEENDLGGQFNLAYLTPHKKAMSKLVPAYVKRLQKENITIIKERAEPKNLIGKYDEIILATGAQPKAIAIPGLEQYYWADILLPENLPEKKNVFIIGGGLIGVDIATALIKTDCKVTIVKRTEDFGGHMEMIAKKLSLMMMKEKNVHFSNHTFVKKIEGKTIYAEREGKQIVFENQDIIILSVGMESNNSLEQQLKNELNDSEIQVHVIGDAHKIGDAQSAIREGFNVAQNI